MTRVNKTWMSVVVAALLLGGLVGVVWARPKESPQSADIVRRVTIPAGFFHPAEDGLNWLNDGALAGQGAYTAPVVFPCLSPVTVKKITLSVEDHNASADACVSLHRMRPKRLRQWEMAMACSTGSVGGAINYDDSSIEYAQVWPADGPYLWLGIGGPSILVYGVTIEYQRII